MTGRHEAPPAGSAAREATASPYIGKRRAPGPFCEICPEACLGSWRNGYSAWEICAVLGRCGLLLNHDVLIGVDSNRDDAPGLDEPDDPPRCWSCGHPFGDGCECSCCNDDHDGGPDDV